MFHNIDYIVFVLYLRKISVMNRIRDRWKNDTPFFLYFKFGGYVANFTQDDCKRLDKIPYDENLTCMDALVDVSYVRRLCENLSDNFLRAQILSACVETIKMVKFMSNLK